MEIEHQHDTASQLPREKGHVNLQNSQGFLNLVDREVGDIKRQAL